MSNEHKLNWLAVLVLIVLIGMIGWLVVVDSARQSQNGLECVYNCDDFKTLVQSLK